MFGQAIPVEKVVGGDILQFKDCVFECRTATSYTRSEAKHHTAVAMDVVGGTQIEVLEANTNGNRCVTACVFWHLLRSMCENRHLLAPVSHPCVN